MASKFVKTLPYLTGAGAPREVPFILRILYEFWGYCVHGGASLTTPGAAAFPSNPSGNPSTLPTNFLEGTTVLATGANGVTTVGTNIFNAVGGGFTQDMVGKYLVLWKLNSDNQDDSIYQIGGVLDSNTLRIQDPTGGVGGPDFVSTLSGRTSINYRVIDPMAAAQLSVAVGNYLVFQATSSQVNSGQPSGQIQLILRGASFENLGVKWSPLGSWNGVNAFGGDGNTEVTSSNGNSWFADTQTSVPGFLTIIGDKDFFILHAKSQNSSANGAILHVETPYRLYTSVQDPAPFAVLIDSSLSTTSTTNGYSGGFRMIGQDGVTRKVRALVQTLAGTGQMSSDPSIVGTILDGRVSANHQDNKIVVSDVLLASVGTANQFTVARCKAKNVIMAAGSRTFDFARVGGGGRFIHVGNGICWPWDNTVSIMSLLPLGL